MSDDLLREARVLGRHLTPDLARAYGATRTRARTRRRRRILAAAALPLLAAALGVAAAGAPVFGGPRHASPAALQAAGSDAGASTVAAATTVYSAGGTTITAPRARLAGAIPACSADHSVVEIDFGGAPAPSLPTVSLVLRNASRFACQAAVDPCASYVAVRDGLEGAAWDSRAAACANSVPAPLLVALPPGRVAIITFAAPGCPAPARCAAVSPGAHVVVGEWGSRRGVGTGDGELPPLVAPALPRHLLIP